MSIEDLRAAIFAMIEAHPNIASLPIDRPNNAYSFRFRTPDGCNLAVEIRPASKVNIFTDPKSVDRKRLSDLEADFYPSSATRRANHDIYHAEGLSKSNDTIRYDVTDIWQFARILLVIAGEGAGS